jgi:S-adenosylmethionine:diacylglycerol 3-amino-3-carboxypropyl transferase
MSAMQLLIPLNGRFLGYGYAKKKWRREIYRDKIQANLPEDDQIFWEQHFTAIENGVVNYGRFEGYIKNIRLVAAIIIGKRNIKKLLECSNVSEQEYVFDKYIASRKAIKYLFRIAFHPVIYKRRGLNSQGLIHARSKTGAGFFNNFRNFCTATLVSRNYFLQYFLTGSCITNESFPEYLQERFRSLLILNYSNITWKCTSLQEELAKNKRCTFSKIHLSNIGDWMSGEDFTLFLNILCRQCTDKEKICYRFLQKNHIEKETLCDNHFVVKTVNIEKTDRFPFYSILSIQSHG